MKFQVFEKKSSIIKVLGVGGGGSNAVNYMFNQGIKGVEFVICNTDAQALETSPIDNKIQLGLSLTEGRGAGSLPEVGKKAALETSAQIQEVLSDNTKMVFITAGLGGGTGTGASPIIAKIAKELNILTVAIVTIPFTFEGKRRITQAEDGLKELTKYVDTILVISNDKLRDMYGNLNITEAFAKADNVLSTAAKGIAEIITIPGYVNVDFEDVKTIMSGAGGSAIMGSATKEGPDRATKAVQAALSSPLLNNSSIRGAKHILLNITSGQEEVLMDEIASITEFIQEQAEAQADIIWGNCYDEKLGNALSVTLIATGFDAGGTAKYPTSIGAKTNTKKAAAVPQNKRYVQAKIDYEQDSYTSSAPVSKPASSYRPSFFDDVPPLQSTGRSYKERLKEIVSVPAYLRHKPLIVLEDNAELED